MKKLFLTLTLLLFVGITFGQQKGNLIGTHVLTVTLDPDVTMNQFKAFVLEKWIPTFEKNSEGVKLFLMDGIRGKHNNSLGLLYVFESEENRDKYFNEDGSQNELGKAWAEKMKPINEAMAKLGSWKRERTDWVIQ